MPDIRTINGINRDLFMNFDEFFGPDPVVVDLRAQDRWQAIEELMNQLVAHQKIKPGDRDEITIGVRKRETAMGTGIGSGIALPHTTTGLVKTITVAIGPSKTGIPFDAADGKPADLVILFIVPQNNFQSHLNGLANIAKIVRGDNFRDWLRRRLE